MTESTPNNYDIETWHDRLGRQIKVRAANASSGNSYYYVLKEYNELGQEYKITEPFLSSSSPNDILVSEQFTYDNMNRLFGNGNHGTNWMDNNGNICNHTLVGTMNYDQNAFNQVTEIVSPQAQCRLSRQVVTYTPFDRTSTISEDDYLLTLHYGPYKNRKKTVLTHNNNSVYTRYFIGNYEKTIREDSGNPIEQEVHYIPCGQGVEVMYVIEDNNADYFYPHKDYLGSILVFTDDNGNIVAEQNFDAWGKYRNPDDWTYSNVPSVPTWLYRGYTGHEMLPEFTLVNMNNRMYDPEIGRFLAVDNFVLDPYSTQDYNRYTYALNNPLMYTDPDGEAVFMPIVLFAAWGGAMGNSIGRSKGLENSALWGYTIAGAAIGASVGFGFGAGIAASKAASAAAAAGNSTYSTSAAFTTASFKSGMMSGGLNMMYNYENGRTGLTGLGYFASGFAGGFFGVAHLGLGMLTSAATNMAVYGIDYGFSGEELSAYQFAQKFVSGALNAYAGVSAFGDVSNSYLKEWNSEIQGYVNVIEDDNLRRLLRVAWMNQLSDFAHTSEETFRNRPSAERGHMMIVAAGSNAIAYWISGRGRFLAQKQKLTLDKIDKAVFEFNGRFLGGTSEYYFLQMWHAHFKDDNSDYYPMNYSGHGRKMNIVTFKSIMYSLKY